MAQHRGQDPNQGRGDPGTRDTSTRGFASMDPAKQRAIAAEGGRAAHAQGVAHEFDSEEARAAGRKGGQARGGGGSDSDRDIQAGARHARADQQPGRDRQAGSSDDSLRGSGMGLSDRDQSLGRDTEDEPGGKVMRDAGEMDTARRGSAGRGRDSQGRFTEGNEGRGRKG